MLNLKATDYRLCLNWALATAIALGFCGVLGPPGLFAGPVVLGIAQAFVLKRYRTRAIFWGLATAIGGYLSLGMFLGLFLLGLLPVFLKVMVSALLLGLAQSLVLRGLSRLWPGWILLTSGALGISVGWFMPLAMSAAIYGTQRPWWQWGLLLALTGIIGGFIKGLALVWLLQPRSPQSSDTLSDR